jgi:hypothetical protein
MEGSKDYGRSVLVGIKMRDTLWLGSLLWSGG